MRLTPGLQVGPYEVVSALGAGGMAEVYRARDVRLGRAVALKVVNEKLSSDPELVRRFEQEARLAGSLNHPNLVAVYDVGQHAGWPFFVTELLQGETLRERLAHGPVPLHTALDWAAQMARGLAAAHAQGIVHRDVKPGNLFVGTDGQVKLLDFGIAKLAAGSPAAVGPRGLLDATLTTPGGTHVTGTVLGTPAYMSPEQVRGEPLDGRSDIFSLGAVLHELLGGGLAFPGSSPVETSYAILHQDPVPLPVDVPAPVAQVVLRCLEKEPGRRFQSASDLAFALELLGAQPGSTVTAPARSLAPRRRRWAVAALALVAAIAGVTLSRARRTAIPSPTIERVTHRWGMVRAARFAPDGRIFFSAAFEGGPEEIYSRPLGSSMAQSLGLVNASLASVSSTGELAVLTNPREIIIHTPHGTLAHVPGVGGTPREVAENVEYADWSSRGELAVVVGEKESSRTLEYPPGKTLFQTSGWISHPRFSHRGDRIAFLHHPGLGEDMGEVMVIDLQGRTKTLTKRFATSAGLAWGPDDREVWFTSGDYSIDTLAAVDLQGRSREVYRATSSIRLADLAPDGSVLLNTEFFRSDLVHVDSSGRQKFLSFNDFTCCVSSLSGNGKIFFSAYDWGKLPSEGGLQVPLAMLRQTDGSRPPQALGEGFASDLSQDGRWALVQRMDGSALTAVPTGPGQPQRIDIGQLTMSPFGARWLPDGRRVVIFARRATDSNPRLFLISTDEGGPRQLSETPLSANQTWQPLFISPDGQTAATVDAEDRPIVISLTTGKPREIPGLQAGATLRGWASNDQLWLTQGSDRPESQVKLLRVDLASGRILDSRIIGPSELTGAGRLNQVVVSPDGREVAFTFFRRLGYLCILKGLPLRP